jgi:streptogramin lyase
VSDGDEVWVLHPGADTLMRIDTATNTIAQTIVVDDGDIFANDFQRFIVKNGAAWLSDTHNNKVVRVDLASGAVVASVEVFLAHSIGATDDAVWVFAASDGTIVRIDPVTNQIVATLDAGDSRYQAVMVTDGEVWAATTGVLVQRIDPATSQPVVAIEMPRRVNTVEALALGAGSVWITSGSEIFRADPQTGEIVAEADTGFLSIFPTFTDGSLWTSDPIANLVRRIDPAG